MATPLLAELSVDGDLASVRRSLTALSTTVGLAVGAAEDLTLAVHEALANALLHGDPPVLLRVLRDGEALVCEVEDAGGDKTDFLAGYVPPDGADEPEGGMGLGLVRHLCDHVAVHSRPGRTVVRLSKQLRGAPAPSPPCTGPVVAGGPRRVDRRVRQAAVPREGEGAPELESHA